MKIIVDNPNEKIDEIKIYDVEDDLSFSCILKDVPYDKQFREYNRCAIYVSSMPELYNVHIMIKKCTEDFLNIIKKG